MRVLVSAVFAVTVIGCDKGHSVELARTAPVQVLWAAYPMRFQSGITTEERLVVRDHVTWAKLWAQLVDTQRPVPGVPPIDFESHVVVVGAMGTQGSAGHSIEVDEVRIDDRGDARITVAELSPGNGCITLAVTTYPVAVVIAPRFEGKATFVERASLRRCE